MKDYFIRLAWLGQHGHVRAGCWDSGASRENILRDQVMPHLVSAAAGKSDKKCQVSVQTGETCYVRCDAVLFTRCASSRVGRLHRDMAFLDVDMSARTVRW